MNESGVEIPGISVRDHCLNVGCVAEALLGLLPSVVRDLLPRGSATLAALHDIGKITLGFQVKTPAWALSAKLDPEAQLNAPFSVSDHALVSQVFVQELLKPFGAQLWAAAVGAHHGRPKGRIANLNGRREAMADWAQSHRHSVTAELVQLLGRLPDRGPNPDFGNAHSDLWLLAGLITVADWIGSNEPFFPPQRGQSADETRTLASEALLQIGWPGGALRSTLFRETFGFDSNSIQRAVGDSASLPGLIIVEAPMGCGKTEAALRAAQQLIVAGHHHGIYFALPTQVTSNRIHRRVAEFLSKALTDPAHLRLAHANAWLEDDSTLKLRPAFVGWKEEDGEHPGESVHEARSWFASAKQALIAPYGVGTIDQALQGVVAVKHFFVRRFALAGKVVILDEIHSYDVYTGTLVTALIRELIRLGCSVIVLSATLTAARRRELLAAADGQEAESPSDYPLISARTSTSEVQTLSPGWVSRREVALRCESISEQETVETLITRAEAGQHVLWIRNTVVEAQWAFRAVRGSMREGEVTLGLLHSRFPFQHRAEAEDEWLERLGRNRSKDGSGSILIATQVVEQSVDIDLDFIVSDLAPTDMLLQRLGRLWRHERAIRAAAHPEFWIRLPAVDPSRGGRELKATLGRSARVYAPYVLLRTAQFWQRRTEIKLPEDIRSFLEATYAESVTEPDGWKELREELEEEKRQLTANAEAAMRVFGLPMLDPEDDHALTRRKGPPTTSVLLLHSVASTAGAQWRLTGLDGTSVEISDYEWRMGAARFVHRWLVRIPRWQVPGDAPRPRWLGLHASGSATHACLQDDGRLRFGDTVSNSNYHRDLGVFAEQPVTPPQTTLNWNDDDEFDS